MYEADAIDTIGCLRNPREHDSQHRNMRSFRVPRLQEVDAAFADRSEQWPPQGVQQGGASSSTTPQGAPPPPPVYAPPKGGPPPPPQAGVWMMREGVWRFQEVQTGDIEELTSSEEDPGIPEGALPVESVAPTLPLALMDSPAIPEPQWSPVD